MNPTALPMGVLGAAALFWGVQADLLLWAIPTALLLEAPRLIAKRWSFGREDFNRFSDLCAALFGVMAVFFYATLEAPEAILTIFRFGPLSLLPLVLGQLFSERARVDMSAFFLFLRRSAREEGVTWDVDLGYPFLAALLLGAASGNEPGPAFFAGCSVFSGVALWSARPARAGGARWAALWLAAVLLGAGVIGALAAGRVFLYRGMLEWSIARFGPRVDPSRTHTAIGRVGRIQESDAVLLRVRAGDPGGEVPALLRDAAYDSYLHEKWFSGAREFKGLLASEPLGAWEVGIARGKTSTVVIMKALPRGDGLLSVPYGTRRIEGLPAEAVEQNGFGALRVRGGPGFASYRAAFAAGESAKDAPGPRDLKLPENEEAGIRAVASDWGLAGATAPKAAAALLARFAADFHYSTYRAEPAGDNPIEEFLTTRRRGHCEYFASASVLLLRAAGVPARYATGFAVRERDRFEDGYVLRGRHAHAWAEAFIDGRWRVVDGTPSSWWAVENARRSRLRPLWDAVDWLRYRWTAWRWRPAEEKGGVAWWIWLLAAAAALIVWRNFRGWRPEAAAREAKAVKSFRVGLDSELFSLEALMAGRGAGRLPGEGMRRWSERSARGAELRYAVLWRRLGLLHERLRFDPQGLDAEERAELAAGAARLAREERESLKAKSF